MAYADIEKKRANGRKWSKLLYARDREKRLADEAARRAVKRAAPKAEKKTHEILRTLGGRRAEQRRVAAPSDDGRVADSEPRTNA